MKRLAIVLCALTSPALAHADVPVVGGMTSVGSSDAPRGSYITVPNPTGPRIGPGPIHRTIFMNRNGITVSPGNDDSIANTSIVPSSTSTVAAFSYGDAAWNELMACVRTQFSRFDVEITDVEPAGGNYIESVVGGTPQQVGLPNGVGGVSPVNGDCSVVERAIVYTFSAVYGGDIQSICEVVAQESGHALGMDHQMLCEDPMTYLYGCGAKSFQDMAAPCGEDVNRTCMCGGTTQNSVQHLFAVLGPANSQGPDANITSPANGATVMTGFSITATATDDSGVTKVDLMIDGAFIDSDASAPYSFVAPASLATGQHTVQVIAYDSSGNTDPSSVTVTLAGGQPPSDCVVDADCGATEHCAGGSCIPNGNPGDLGTPCAGNDDCTSNICGSDGTDDLCTQSCNPSDATSCPDGFACLNSSGGGGVCWPAGNGGEAPGLITGSCSVGDTRGAGTSAALLLLGLLLLGAKRRRR